MSSLSWSNFISLDAPALFTAMLSAASCALLGNFLVLRRLSLMGDAISHSVLPGIVAAFLISGTRASGTVFIGAAIAGVLTAVCVELVGKLGRVDSGAAMGVVFSLFFAAGVLMIEQAAARSIDLDADCLLHGQLETIFWFPPQEAAAWLSYDILQLVPEEVWSSLVVFVVIAAFVFLFFKELALSAFDAELSTALGFSAAKLHYVLMVFVAAAVVASFKAVGSILVIAMLICPAATARLLTDRLKTQVLLSLFFALLATAVGYFSAAFGPLWLGYQNSLSAAGMMTVVSGILLFSAVALAPQYGILPRTIRRMFLSIQVAREDLLGLAYRAEETVGDNQPPLMLTVPKALEMLGGGIIAKLALRQARRDRLLSVEAGQIVLSLTGRTAATSLVRTHRLWESYLVDELQLRPDHVHQRATQLEHFTSSEQYRVLEQAEPVRDPHGREIPKVEPDTDTDTDSTSNADPEGKQE